MDNAIIYFYEPQEQPYGDLSPFSEHWFFVEPYNMSWKSCQQYLLAQRYVDPAQVEAIHKAKTLEDAQTLAANWNTRPDWKEIRDHHLELCTRSKFAENLYLQFLLSDTDDAELIYADPEDSEWGIGPDGQGKNKLGGMLMTLRSEFQAIHNDPQLLQCPHHEEATRRQICIHLLKQPAYTRSYYRYYSDEPGYFAIICSICREQPEQITSNLRSVCKSCFMDYLGKELGQVGALQFLQRPSTLHFSHHDISFPGLKQTEILDIKPIEGLTGNKWLALTTSRQLIQIDFEQEKVITLFKIPDSPIDWRYKVQLHTSRNGRFAAITNLRGQYGVVINLENGGITLVLDRGVYHVVQSTFPLIFAEIDGQTVMIHGTAWNRLTISDPATGKELTAREPALWKKGGPAPQHYLDYFHGRLTVSPDQEWIADWGWVWHPVGMIRCWNLKKWLYENVWESEDAYNRKFLCYRSYFWDGPICWADSQRLIAWGYGEDDLDIIPAATILDAQNAQELSWFVGPVSSNQPIKVPGKDKDFELSIPAGNFVFDEYLFSFDYQAGMTIWDIETGERLFSDEHFYPAGYHRTNKCFLTYQGNGRFTISLLEK